MYELSFPESAANQAAMVGSRQKLEQPPPPQINEVNSYQHSSAKMLGSATTGPYTHY
jgi:hypothetical protein